MFPGVHFSALHASLRSRQLCPRDFCWPAGLIWGSTQWSSFPVCSTHSSAGKFFTTALPWVGDTILSSVPLSLHVWVMLQQQREKHSSDYLCSEVSVIIQHGLPLTWLKFWKYKLNKITSNTVPNWQRRVLCHRFCSNYSFAINGAETGIGYAWPRARLLFSLLSVKWDYTALTSKGSTVNL